MQRYFLENNRLVGNSIHLLGDDYHHIVKVMRMNPGDIIGVVFPDGKVAICELSDIKDEHVEVTIQSWDERNRELPIEVTIGLGLLKGEKFELVIQKGTELGATHFIPITAERSVVKLDEKKAKKRIDRWQKIAKEAAEQSERNIIPTIERPTPFKQLLKEKNKFTSICVAYEEQGRSLESSTFVETLSQLQPGDSLLILIGPEGGFSDAEIQMFQQEGFKMCGLGPRILRAETAPLYALSSISFYFELLNKNMVK